MEEDKSEKDIREVCEQILNLLRPDLDSNKPAQLQKLLTAPVNLGALARDAEEHDEKNSIWLKEADLSTLNVDKEALKKAEEVLKKKQDKKDKAGPKTVANKYGSREATASQVFSKAAAKADASGGSGIKDIHLENFDISYGEKVLIKGADVTLIYGRRYGFVGRNGLGKTTVLRMISEGQLRIPSHITVLHVEQEVIGDETQAIQSVLEADIVREGLLQEEKELTSRVESGAASPEESSRLTEVFQSLEAIDSAKAPARAAVILSGLGFTTAMQSAATRTFSGGWRMRIALARALFSSRTALCS